MAKNPYKIHYLQGIFEHVKQYEAADDLVHVAEVAQKHHEANVAQVDIPGSEAGNFVCIWDGPKETDTDAFKAAVQKYMEWDDSECPWNQ